MASYSFVSTYHLITTHCILTGTIPLHNFLLRLNMQSFRIFRKALGCALISICLGACIKLPPTVGAIAVFRKLASGTDFVMCKTYGSEDAPVLIVLHGGPGADFRYLLNLSVLSDQYRVVFYDQLGTGLSQRVEAKDISVDTFVRDLDAVVEHFGRKRKVILLGHSWGAMLASAYLENIHTK